MIYPNQLQLTTKTNQDISSDFLAATYTADRDRTVSLRITLDEVEGNGDYEAYVSIRELGAGSFFRIYPTTSISAGASATAIGFTSIDVPLLENDVLNVYVKGTAGDTTTPDISVHFFEQIVNPIVEGDLTLIDVQKILAAFHAGKASGGDTAQIIFRDTTDTYNRITLNVDGAGNRSSVVLDTS